MLTESVKLYIPSTLNVKADAPKALITSTVEATMRLFAILFGGFTCTKGKGGWMAENGTSLVVEDVYMVASFCDRAALVRGLPGVIERAKVVCDRFGQECVSLEVSGALYFVSEGTNAEQMLKNIRERLCA